MSNDKTQAAVVYTGKMTFDTSKPSDDKPMPDVPGIVAADQLVVVVVDGLIETKTPVHVITEWAKKDAKVTPPKDHPKEIISLKGCISRTQNHIEIFRDEGKGHWFLGKYEAGKLTALEMWDDNHKRIAKVDYLKETK